jgi:DNA-binding transcriptional LysR family regulator
MDRLRAMSVFVAVAELGSFAAAADRAGVSRTAASRLVKELEAHLGAALMNRTTRRLSLTRAGNAYLERVRRALELIEDADREAHSGAQSPRGTVRVSAPMAFGVRHIAPRLGAYLDRYGDVDIDLVLNDRRVDLVEEGFDLAVRIGRLADSSLIARTIATTRMVLCASASYLEAHGQPARPDDLTGHNCLGYAFWSGRNRWELIGPDGTPVAVAVSGRLWSNNGDALVNAAAGGLGIIFQPDFIVHEALARGSLIEVLEGHAGPEIGIHVVYAPTAFMPTRVRSFIDFLARSFAGPRPWSPAGADSA